MATKDQLLIAGIINGDEQVLTRFYSENFYYIQAHILRNYGNVADVEDIFQDALVVLYQKLCSGTLELHASLRTYFFGICKNLWRNHLRKKENLYLEDTKNHFELVAHDVITEDIENSEREHIYSKHFGKLPPEKKKILQLFLEGKSMKEISKICGYSESCTRKKKFDAKKKLLKMIEKDPMYAELKAVC